jgi:hypothetical protein
MWQNLVPGNLPARYLNLAFSNFNPKRSLAAFDFAGFVHLDETMTSRPRFDFEKISYYFSPSCVEKIAAGQNYYGVLFSIEVGTTFVQLEEYCMGAGACQDTSMRLLKRLVIALKLECQWQSYSHYYDSGEYSQIHKGTEKELRALLVADRSSPSGK